MKNHKYIQNKELYSEREIQNKIKSLSDYRNKNYVGGFGIDGENNYILNLNENRAPYSSSVNKFSDDRVLNLLNNTNYFKYDKTIMPDKSNIVEFKNDIKSIKEGVFNSIKDNVNIGNIVFDTRNVKGEIDENFEKDEELFMFFSTKPCSNEVQEKENIV